MSRLLAVILVLGTVLGSGAFGKTLEEETPVLVQALAKQLVSKQKPKVAALDFTDIQGRPNELGRFLAEQLAVDMVAAEGITVVDRANINSIMAEHQLTAEGLVRPENAKKLGEFAGVDAILIGTLTPLDSNIVLIVKAISTETAEVIAAGKTTFTKTRELQQLLSKAVGTVSGAPSSGSRAGSPQTSSSDASAIVTKEFDALRVALMNVMPVRGKVQDGDGAELITGMRCSFELSNLDLQKTLAVACNGRAAGDRPGKYVMSAGLTDSNGKQWNLCETRGIPAIACACGGDPSQIVSLLREGKCVPNKAHKFGEGKGVWTGDFAEIAPGKSIRVTLLYSFMGADCVWPVSGVVEVDFFRLDTELVIGSSQPGDATVSYSLTNLSIDRIDLPKSDSRK